MTSRTCWAPAWAGWRDRDTVRGTAAQRQAGGTAVMAIDSILRECYLLRGQLVRELSDSDAAAAARADALLQQRQEGE